MDEEMLVLSGNANINTYRSAANLYAIFYETLTEETKQLYTLVIRPKIKKKNYRKSMNPWKIECWFFRGQGQC